jgi:hypothetical protein
MSERVFITIPFLASLLTARRRKDDRLYEEEPAPIVPGSEVVHETNGWRGKVEKLNTGASASSAAAYVEWMDGPVPGQKDWVGLAYLHTALPQRKLFASTVKTAITLPEIVRETNAFSKKYRPGCQPKLLDSNPKALFLHYNVKCNKEDSDPSGHDVRIQFDVTHVQDSQQAKDLDVQVSCSCPAFLYWGAQWNLHQRDGLLGTPRPQLVAPTERLELRGNFVICKHIHSVFERILPSVQHNIVKLLREREVLKNKQKMEETPDRLKQKQDEMKKKKDRDSINKEKDKDTQDAMIDALREEEEGRLLHQQQLDNQGGTPGPVEDEEEVTQDTLPSEGITEMAPGDEDLHALEELAKGEEKKIKEQHREHTPHEHRGLPYEIHTPTDKAEEAAAEYEIDTGHGVTRRKLSPEDARKMRGKGWKGERVSAQRPTPDTLHEGDRVCFDVNPSITGVVMAVHKTNITVRWDEEKYGPQVDVPIDRLRFADSPRLFSEYGIEKENPITASIGTVAKIAMRFEDIKRDMRVVYIPSMMEKRMEGTVTRVSKPTPDATRGAHLQEIIHVKWDMGHESDVPAWTLGNADRQKTMDFEDMDGVSEPIRVDAAKTYEDKYKRVWHEGQPVEYYMNYGTDAPRRAVITKLYKADNPDDLHYGDMQVQWDENGGLQNVHAWQLRPVQGQMPFSDEGITASDHTPSFGEIEWIDIKEGEPVMMHDQENGRYLYGHVKNKNINAPQSQIAVQWEECWNANDDATSSLDNWIKNEGFKPVVQKVNVQELRYPKGESTQQGLFAATAAKNYPTWRPGDQVYHAWDEHAQQRTKGEVVDQDPFGGAVRIRYENGETKVVNPFNVKKWEQQRGLFAAGEKHAPLWWKEIRKGMRVKGLPADDAGVRRGTVANPGRDQWAGVTVNWDNGDTSTVPCHQLYEAREQKALQLSEGDWV